MRVGGSSIQSLVSNGLQGRDENRLQQEALRAREKEQRSPQPPQPDVQISDAARQAAAYQQVVPTTRAESSQASYQYYRPVEQNSLPASNQRALQAYTSTQQISRETQGSGEFLGSVDLFV